MMISSLTALAYVNVVLFNRWFGSQGSILLATSIYLYASFFFVLHDDASIPIASIIMMRFKEASGILRAILQCFVQISVV